MRFFRFAPRVSRTKTYRHRPLLIVEQLEDRSLLSASLIADFQLLGRPAPGPQYQWDMTKIKAPSVWAATDNGPKVVVADIDTGIDYTHPDLYLNVWINQTEVPSGAGVVDADTDGIITFWDLNDPANIGIVANTNDNDYIDAGDLLANPIWANNVDNDNNGYIDDLIGWNFVDGNNNPMDDNGHGTHTAGTLGAIHNGAGNGVDGVFGKTQIMALKAFDQDGGAATVQLALDRATAAIYYSADNGAHVSNNSWAVRGFGEKKDGTVHVHQALYDAIVATPDVLFVASAGNNGVNNDTSSQASFPASYDLPNIISVAATNSSDQKPIWSSYGATTVDLGAPGVNVLSTVPGGYAIFSGTSMAAPHVAGAAALIMSQNPDLDALQVKGAILNSVDSVKSMSNTVSKGRLNVANALTTANLLTSSSSSAASSGTGQTGPTAPTGNGRGGRLTQRDLTATPSDVDGTASPVDPLFALGDIPLLNGSAFSDFSRFSAVADILLPPTVQPGSRSLIKIEARYFDETESEPMPPDDVPVIVVQLEAAAPAATFSTYRRSESSVETPSFRVVHAETSVAAPIAGDAAVNPAAPTRENAAATRTESDSTGESGFLADMLTNTASKLLWIAIAAFCFAPGAWLTHARTRVEEEFRKRWAK